MHFNTSGSSATYRASFGQGTGAVVLRNVGCTGSEQRLIDCPSSNSGGCSHSQDAGVRCYMRTGY